MKNAVFVLISALSGHFVQAVQFNDDFNRAQTVFETNETVSIGSGYVLTQTAGDQIAEARILANQIQFNQINPVGSTVNAGNVVLRQTGIGLKNSNAGDSFSVSGDIKTHNAAVGTLLYGLAFNYQPDGSFYAARIDTGTDATVLQFIRVNAAGGVTGFSNIANSVPLALSSIYHLVITSTAPGVLHYTLDGANLDGGQLSGTATDTTLKLANGQAGFYTSSANTTPLYDNLSIESLPDVVGTLRLYGISTVSP